MNTPDALSAELLISDRLAHTIDKATTHANSRIWYVPSIEPLHITLKAVSAATYGTGIVDGYRTGQDAVLHLSPDLNNSIPGIDCTFPFATTLVQAIKEGSLVYSGAISWGTAALNVAVKTTSVAGASAIGVTLGTLICPGIGTVIGGMVGGFAGGWVGNVFINREIRGAQKACEDSRSAWEGRMERERASANASIEAVSEAVSNQYHSANRRLFKNCAKSRVWIARLVGAFTPNGSLPVIRGLLANRVRRRNQQTAKNVLRAHRASLSLFRKAKIEIQNQLAYKVAERQSLMEEMFAELRAHNETLTTALHRRGRA